LSGELTEEGKTTLLGDTFTVTLDGSGGTAYVLPKINQDGYSAEYFGKQSTFELRVRVKHMTEKTKATEQSYDRHLLEITKFEYVTEALPIGRYTQVYMIIRNDPNTPVADVTNLGEALTYVTTDTILDKLNGWES